MCIGAHHTPSVDLSADEEETRDTSHLDSGETYTYALNSCDIQQVVVTGPLNHSLYQKNPVVVGCGAGVETAKNIKNRNIKTTVSSPNRNASVALFLESVINLVISFHNPRACSIQRRDTPPTKGETAIDICLLEE